MVGTSQAPSTQTRTCMQMRARTHTWDFVIFTQMQREPQIAQNKYITSQDKSFGIKQWVNLQNILLIICWNTDNEIVWIYH